MQQLGIFPSFQYSADPSVNPLLNPHVQYPPGMYQTTAQPAQPYYGSRGDGLGGFWSSIFPRKRAALMGSSSIGSAVSGIGTLLVLGLAGLGGVVLYKKIKG